MVANAEDEKHEGRIAALEVGVKGFTQTLHGFKTDVDDKFDGLGRSIESLRRDFAERGKTAWPTYIAALAVVLVIVGMIGNGYVRDQNRNEDDLEVLIQKYNGHQADPLIHYSLRERVLHHEGELEKINNEINYIRGWQEKHAEKAGTSHAEARVKIAHLEKHVADLMDRMHDGKN